MELTEDLQQRFRAKYMEKLNEQPPGAGPARLNNLALEARACFSYEEQEILRNTQPEALLGGPAQVFGELVDGVFTVGLRFPKVDW